MNPRTPSTRLSTRPSTRTRTAALLAATLLGAGALTACSGDGSSTGSGTGSGTGSDTGADTELTVLAAASLTETYTALADEFEAEHPGVEVTLAFDSSATLAAQAVQGAPADVLATADLRTMQDATDALADAPQLFASNQLVGVTPADDPAGISDFADAVAEGVDYVACVATAPCGDLWATIADEQGVTTDPASLEVDVKAVLQKVTSGEADAGFVYSTDAVAAGDDVTSFAVPGAADHLTDYAVAPLSQAEEPDLAVEFIDLVLSDAGQQVLADAGFGAPRDSQG
ncbi:molybdate ABC transporter substrate-binding protein [Nocardioides bruguierae]|uniref:Molybdate ABC transporter substrate-binding protein n=1 Tax=Nocardioides bruguierae TaxID=2945102 RepID=A0A9X2D9V3_9ACTN|nr:molybdate ABC transporter substrate-binding protein [Nocardioides bruguierae]MCM0622035.1 molybdate ABC transporter substrate-binding protein [Nocardioides bruguierae]